MLDERDALPPFQRAAVETLDAVLKARSVEFDGFHVKQGTVLSAWATFQLDGEEHTIGVFDREINMREGASLFEAYLPSEFRTPDALIASFALRLDRYLRERIWSLPEEE
jgi:hypothetical protein